MAAIAGLRGTGDWGTDERPKNFRESILWMRPEGDTPIFGLMSKTGKMAPTDDPEFSWWCEPQDLVRLQIAGGVGSGSSETLLTVDSSDPDASNIKQNYGTAQHLVPGDVLMVEPATDSATDNYERLIVTAVHSPTQFSVQRGAMGTTPAAIANDVFLLKIGSMFAEGTPEPQATSRNPIKFSNLTQIFKTSYEITNTAKQTRARTGDALSNDKKRRAFDHARDIELAMLFSKKSEIIGSNGKPLRTMDGLRQFIPSANRKILAANWGLVESASAGNNLIDMISPIFDYESPAGATRIAFCGNGTMNALNRAIVTEPNVDLSWTMDKNLWGMNFRQLVFPQGRILLKTHPLLSRHSLYTYSMWILDFSSIKYRAMKGRDTKAEDNIQSKGEDLQRGQWLTECSLMVDYAGQTQGYIGGFDQVFGPA